MKYDQNLGSHLREQDDLLDSAEALRSETAQKYLSIDQCPSHKDFYAVSIENASGGKRITPSKCCGSWRTLKRWPLESVDLFSEYEKQLTQLRADLREYKNTADALQELRTAQEEQLAQLRATLEDAGNEELPIIKSGNKAALRWYRLARQRTKELTQLREELQELQYADKRLHELSGRHHLQVEQLNAHINALTEQIVDGRAFLPPPPLIIETSEQITQLRADLQAREREVIELKEAFIDVCYDMTGMPRERAEICLEDTLKHVATRVEATRRTAVGVAGRAISEDRTEREGVGMWFKWFLVVMIALSTGIRFGQVGQPREPITPGGALFNLLENGLMIAGIIYYWQ